ncbi:hypothetical protein Q644_15280 [Brucella intermedia 229E]|uniref:Uncharacterized protein n=1 Tax=Brucella intermedia 229E TaxID=1337887 RepID=U4VIP6_9HYPH|nr:hypothetical protein Q644_15280 [Brucella intermedia 229E]
MVSDLGQAAPVFLASEKKPLSSRSSSAKSTDEGLRIVMLTVAFVVAGGMTI